MKPSALLYRNFLAMETEELIRTYPIDGVVLMGGCDKTTPGLLMGATSANVPAIYFPAGPMLRGNFAGEPLGSGSDTWKYWDERRAGNISDDQWREVEAGIARSYGHCMTMGTASTMTAMVDALGMSLTGASSILAADSSHKRMAAATGRRIVDMVWEDLKPADIQTRKAFENAVIGSMAMGGSTNAIIHLLALSRRAGSPVTLDEFDALSARAPVLANIRPSGDTYLMEDFFYAGGLRALLGEVRDLLHLDCVTASGQTLGEGIAGASIYNDDVIRRRNNPVSAEGSLAVLKGNLAPGGAVMKPAAANPKFLKHTGPALVFDSYPEIKRACEDPDLDVTEDTILILRNAGPIGGPGMPEWGMLPLPIKLVKQGVRDMVRLSDARMSGTSYGACVLHCAPEAFIGGPLALVNTGDLISIDVAQRSIHLHVSDEDLALRRAAWVPPEPRFERGFGWMVAQHIEQADKGCDLDFASSEFGRTTPMPEATL
ncbi:MAG: dihydroxy-acid dehydratase [Rhodospirillaceae bacterium]|nr:dihydroxy-acid dehydratase [Rhodospirillaceae bacterium]